MASLAQRAPYGWQEHEGGGGMLKMRGTFAPLAPIPLAMPQTHHAASKSPQKVGGASMRPFQYPLKPLAALVGAVPVNRK